MENIRKIKQKILLVCILMVGTTAWAQNFYPNSIIYYNMDTANSLLNARDLFAKYDMTDSVPIIIEEKLYNVYRTTINIPVVKNKDKRLEQMVEESIKESLVDGTIWAPDTSGYFVYLIVELDSQSLQYDIIITPTSNYYMYDMLVKYQQLYKYNTICCFYFDSILCVVQSCCSGVEIDYNCMWEETGNEQKIVLYQQEIEYLMEYYGPISYFHINPCE